MYHFVAVTTTFLPRLVIWGSKNTCHVHMILSPFAEFGVGVLPVGIAGMLPAAYEAEDDSEPISIM